jgi:hypothetical protein
MGLQGFELCLDLLVALGQLRAHKVKRCQRS